MRISEAKMPPMKKKMVMVMRYRIAMRL